LGACISPFTAYLNILGIETLSLRINKICDNAFNLANMLIEHPKVRNINYPGLVSSKYYVNAKKYLRKYGPVLTIELDSKESCFRFIDNLKLIRRATNIYDNKTLVIHPSSTIFSEYTENKKLELGVSDNMIRFSVGIEDVEDLYQDIIHALEEV
jgi:O-acetylhomoserine (thiol)-lyase